MEMTQLDSALPTTSNAESGQAQQQQEGVVVIPGLTLITFLKFICSTY